MQRMRCRTSRKGFSLIEMLIVIVVIAILALIVIPRLLGQGRKVKEASLKGDLHQLRGAIAQFEEDCGGYPVDISQLIGEKPTGDVPLGNGKFVEPEKWQGPYLHTPDGKLPQDPFTGAYDWRYDAQTGEIHSASTMTAINGEKYNTW